MNQSSFRRGQVQGMDSNLKQVQTNQRQANFTPVIHAGQKVSTKGAQLAEALGTFHKPLQNHMLSLIERDNEENQQRAEADALTMTPEQAAEKVLSGELEQHKNPHYQKRFAERAAYLYARQVQRSLSEEWEQRRNEIGDTDNFEEWYSSRLAEAIEPFQNSPDFLRGFSAVMQVSAPNAADAHAEYVADETQRITMDQKGDYLYEQFGLALENDVPPQEALQHILSEWESDQFMMNLSYKDQNSILMRVAARLAMDGHAAMVEEIFDNPRNGVGPLGNTEQGQQLRAAYLDQAHATQLEARHRDVTEQRVRFDSVASQGLMNPSQFKEHLDQFFYDPANKGAITDEQYLSLLRTHEGNWLRNQGSGGLTKTEINRQLRDEFMWNRLAPLMDDRGGAAFLPLETLYYEDADGNPVEVSPDMQKTLAMEIVQKRADIALETTAAWREQEGLEPLTPEQEREVHDIYTFDGYSKAGVQNKHWVSQMYSVARSLENIDLADLNADSQQMQNAAYVFDRYIKMHQRNPIDALDHLKDDKTRILFEGVRIAREVEGIADPIEAIKAGVNRVQTYAAMGPMDHAGIAATARARASKVAQDPGMIRRMFLGESRVLNRGHAQARLNTMIKQYMESGMDGDAAEAQAVETLRSRSGVVNGTWVEIPSSWGDPNEAVSRLQDLSKQLGPLYAAGGGQVMEVSTGEVGETYTIEIPVTSVTDAGDITVVPGFDPQTVQVVDRMGTIHGVYSRDIIRQLAVTAARQQREDDIDSAIQNRSRRAERSKRARGRHGIPY